MKVEAEEGKINLYFIKLIFSTVSTNIIKYQCEAFC
jgi:hypothetical protein